MTRTLRAFFLAASFSVGLTGLGRAQVITVTPGLGPLPFYFPISFFGATQLALGNDDQAALDIDPFTFGGRVFSSINVSSNGYLTYGGDHATTPVNQHLPDATPPNGVLAPFWTDLDPSAGGGVFEGAFNIDANMYTVIDWENVPTFHDNSITNSFEIFIRSGDVEEITFAYGAMGGPDNGLGTIGAENIYGNVGDTYFYNGDRAVPDVNDMLSVRSDGLANLPEPASLTLMGTGLIAVGAIARRRKTKAS